MNARMRKNILMIFSFFVFEAHAQYILQSGSKIEINTTSGDMNVFTQNQILQCGDPQTEGPIEYATCGFNSTLGTDGKCYVNSNETFEIDYGLNGASSCTGTNGTPGWQGVHPIGLGTGDYSYSIIGGINKETVFTLNCSANQINHNFKRVIHRGVLDLRNMVQSGRAYASLFKQYRVFDMTGQEPPGLNSINHDFDFTKANQGELLIRQHGTEIHSLIYNNKTQIDLSSSFNRFNDDVATYMVITDEVPDKSTELPKYKASGHCDVLSTDNTAQLNVTTKKGKKGWCHIGLGTPSYLIWYLLEK